MVTISNRDVLKRTPAHEVALDCVVAGLEAAHPETVVDESVSVRGDVLGVESALGDERVEYDLARYENVFVVGGGNAAGHLARTL